MKILLDECLPRDLKLHFPEYECKTVQDMGWSGKKNGILAGMAEGRFDALVTIDQKFNYQIRPTWTLVILIVSAKTNRIEDLEPLVPVIRRTLRSLKRSSGIFRIP